MGGQHHAPAALPPGKIPLYRRLGGPQGRSGRVRKISPPPGFDPRTVQPVAQSLYRLSYPAHTDARLLPLNAFIACQFTLSTLTSFIICCAFCGGPGSSVGIATDYGLYGPGIESRWGCDFSHMSRPALGRLGLLYNGYRVFPGGKAATAWC